jgi:5-methylcytosine-specific restriction endonuclease McrA
MGSDHLYRLPEGRQIYALREPDRNSRMAALVPPELSMKRISKFCRVAFVRQCGLCYYCGLPMIPRGAVEQLSSELALSLNQAQSVTATAEHLHARSDGGADTEKNIAAAHLVCNQRRHHVHPAPDPETYKAKVKRRLAKGGWLDEVTRQRLETLQAKPFPGDHR